jgi:bifunctional UDP-N-acetylglucosamine pyrophosphorylase/glucosamine-1-phosphate N-acetyltransferase
VGRDTVIGPFVQLLGDTKIGEDCHIGACSVIHDSKLGDRVVIGPFTVVGASELEDGVQAGPFARLRFGNHLAADARVGNFVEMKKARLGAGSKAMHLAYLGDAVVGARANIGAGTITCNYDGVHKHQTIIGDGAFVGSNSTLVAPVTIGGGSYVAAGSVITKEVPVDALGVGRGRQENKPQWAKKRREKRTSQA